MRARILHHDRCFDGACSAAIFTDFFRKVVAADADVDYAGLFHQANQVFPDELFPGDENAIVDFKFAPHPKLTWWFDHHQSAFLCEADEAMFRSDRSGHKFYDPGYRSCTQFIADIGRERFGYDPTPLNTLIHCADIIDSASYDSAEQAVMMPEAAMKLTLVFEASRENLTQQVIPLLLSESMESIMRRPDIAPVFEELFRKHLDSIEIIRQRAACRDGVIFFDLADAELAGYNKFIPYYLFPQSVYTVSIVDAGFRTKISVGSNPWSPVEPTKNLASLCERYGGGGHPRVGAISYGPGEIERARASAAEIVEELTEAAQGLPEQGARAQG
ncbi:MAG: phosphoesterase [Acidobacteria bacterium]|nr:phosphoesterase [Acidobacteriota bacterium]